jgi:endothelin-converting enzyme/putative endopeptidase
MNSLTHIGVLVLAIDFALSAAHPCALAQASRAASDGKSQATKLHPGLDLRLIDTSADPCVDFAAYSCGNFDKYYPIPPDKSGYGTGAIIYDRNQEVLRGILEKYAVNDSKRSANERKIGDFYVTCMDEEAIHKEGLKPLQPALDSISALTDKKELTDLLAHDQLINVNAFFGYGEQQDFKDAQKQIAVVDQGGLGLPERDYYLRTGAAAEETRKQYVEHIANMLFLMGEPREKAASDAQKIMALETALAKVSMDVTSQRDPKNVYHPMTVEQLGALNPGIDWPRFFAKTSTPPVTELNVANPDFFKGLHSLLESTDIETIRTYLRWQLINSTPSYALPKTMDEERFDFYRHKLRGQQVQEARWKRCVRATDVALGEALGQVYVASQFPPENKAATLQMVRDIEDAMDREIDSLGWMGSDTKVRAKAKLHLVANKIGYPDRWRDYSALKVVRGDAVGNEWRAAEFENHRQLAKIGKPVDRGEWLMSPPTVDAYYNPSMNDMNFMAGILQPPLYDASATDAENYGHIGGVVGHELTHGFDDQGRQFDGNGNLSSWWDAEDEKKFNAMADCEVKEYGNFVAVDDVKVNGKLTLGENTADNGGLRLSYMAFMADAKRKSIDLTVKQDGYTPIQQFFLAHGQNWCGKIRPEQVRLQVQTDPHSPREFRVNGVVQNMPEFGEAFGCKPGQPMMPANACRVW